MKFLSKMERKYGRYAIRNLPAIIIALYAAGYILSLFQANILSYCTLEPYYILRGQIWRLVTWILVPPGSPDLFTIIMLFFYYSIGKTLERTWGAFRFNVYIFGGLIFTVLGSFLLYFILGGDVAFGTLFSTYYINMSIFLAFAVSYPDMQVLLYFIIPIKMKWMGLLYGVFIIYEFVGSTWVGKVAIIASLLNFVIYFLMTRNYRRVSPKEIHRKQEFKRAVAQASPSPKAGPKHKCVVCGRTEQDGEHLEFRYCSKCDGDYEYCQDHLFSHQHIHKQ
ncbi:MAG: hypothetical protein PHE06_11380 [Lachnospiraceae bacterium]|nr:hypothetical protein [Lachnospiraceae bacterium]MDD3796545.1 hypothetical protein [Lachnospiraceae bacterium]